MNIRLEMELVDPCELTTVALIPYDWGWEQLFQFVPCRPDILDPLPLCCKYPAEKCPIASVVLTSTFKRH